MSVLHTISKAPAAGLLQSCLAVCSKGDSILLIEDGVYYSIAASELEAVPDSIPVHALREDMIARGLLERRQSRVEAANTTRFVQLCCDHDKVLSWF